MLSFDLILQIRYAQHEATELEAGPADDDNLPGFCSYVCATRTQFHDEPAARQRKLALNEVLTEEAVVLTELGLGNMVSEHRILIVLKS